MPRSGKKMINSVTPAFIQAVVLEFATPERKDDENYVTWVVAQAGWALQFASPRLRASRAVVLAAVKSDGMALQFASPALRADPDVVVASTGLRGPPGGWRQLLKLDRSCFGWR